MTPPFRPTSGVSQHRPRTRGDAPDRTGTGTIKVHDRQLVFDLRKGFPLVTTKKLHARSIFVELLFFLRGEHDNQWLTDRGVTIWNEWRSSLAGQDGYPESELGPIYGVQWRHFGGDLRDWTPGMAPNPDYRRDQLAQVLDRLKTKPFDRRHVISAWNPVDLDQMALPPCHMEMQFSVMPNNAGQPKRLDLFMRQRSVDSFLGLPFNIASYALLLHIVAKEVGLVAGKFTHSLGDTHLYLNHLEQARTQLNRDPLPLPTLTIADRPKDHPDDILPNYTLDDFMLTNYRHHDRIAAPISV